MGPVALYGVTTDEGEYVDVVEYATQSILIRHETPAQAQQWCRERGYTVVCVQPELTVEP